MSRPSMGPHDDLRAYLDALEEHGQLLRIDALDQSRFEATAFAYRLVERYGVTKAPAFLVEKVTLEDGSVHGPIVGNAYGPAMAEALAIGLEGISDDHHAMYRAAISHFTRLAGFAGYPKVPPHEVESADAPVKEVVLTGDDVDLFALPFIQSNPADAGRYVTTGNVVLQDERLGVNVGTYRCQIKSSNKLGVNAGLGQDGRAILMAKKARGEKVAHCAIAVGTDPLMFAASCAKLGPPGMSELEIAGGLRGRPVDVVKAEHSDLLVPARAEIVIEGEIPLDAMEPEGPFAELYGYLGSGWPENWFMNVTAITHRRDPIGQNAFTGIERGFLQAAAAAAQTGRYRSLIPGLVAIHLPTQSMTVHVMSIRKSTPGQGMSAGLTYAGSFGLAKLVIVVDDDVDIYNYDAVMNAVAARWQPSSATTIVPRASGPMADPSVGGSRLTSKAVIDATRLLPEEGGRTDFPPMSRTLLSEAFPGVFDDIDARWDGLIADR
jgi:4-hydroxy-3-polyprenylbenzoate decarboxylase